MEFAIYSIGDIDFLEQVLISLAMLSGIKDFQAMVQVGLLIGVFSAVISAVSKGGKEIEFQHIFLGYIIWATMFVPTARVNIQDTFTTNVRVVDNVPIGAAAAGGIISLIGYKLTSLFEQAYSPIVPKTTESEFSESLKILTDIRKRASQPAIWKALNSQLGGGAVDLYRSWANYIRDCSLKKVDLHEMDAQQLVDSSYLDSLHFSSALFGTTVYLISSDYAGQLKNCGEAWGDLNSAISVEEGSIAEGAFDAVLNLSKATGTFVSLTKTNNALAALEASATSAQDYMKMSILEPVMMQAATNKYKDLSDTSGAIMVNQAIQQRNTQWATEQTLFMSIVRPMIAFFEAFIYAITPIMAFVIALGAKGIQLAGKYFTTLIWIQLWMPLLSIINLYIYTAASRDLAKYSSVTSYNWNSFYALNSSADVMQSWIATGGILAASTPAIALMLIYGSSVTATHLAGRLKSDRFVDSEIPTPDVTRTGPLLNSAASFQGDPSSGTVKTNTPDFDISLGSQFSTQAQSLNTDSLAYSNQIAASIRGDLTNGSATSFDQARAAELGNATQTMYGRDRNLMNQVQDAVSNVYGKDWSNSNQINGLTAAYISGGLPSTAFAGAVAGQITGQMGSTDSASEAEKRQRLINQLNGLGITDQDRTGFNRSLASNLTETTRSNDTSSWQNTKTLSSARQLAATATSADQFSKMASTAETLGISSQLKGVAASNFLSANKGALSDLYSTYSNLASANPTLREAYVAAMNSTDGKFGSVEQHTAYSLLKAMSSPLSYTSGKAGREALDRDNLRVGLGAVMKALSSTSPNTPSGFHLDPGAAYKNQGVGSATPDLKDNPAYYGKGAELVNAAAHIAPESPLLETPHHLNVTPSTASKEVDGKHIDNTGRVFSQDDKNQSRFGTNTGLKRQEFGRDHFNKEADDYNARANSGDTIGAPVLSSLLGRKDAYMKAIGSSVGDFAEVATAKASATSSSFNNKMEEINNMTPQQLAQYEQHLQDIYGDTSAYKDLKQAATNAGTSIMGFLSSGFMDKPEGMSYKGFQRAVNAAIAISSAEGMKAGGAMEGKLFDAAYTNKLEEAQMAGLDGSTADLYAASAPYGLMELNKQATPIFGLPKSFTGDNVEKALGMQSGDAQSQRYTASLNKFKIEHAPKNTDQEGYAYTMVGDTKQYLTDSSGQRIRNFEMTTNEHGLQQVKLTDPRMEAYTNNVANEFKEMNIIGKDSDRLLTNVAGMEKLHSLSRE